MISAIRATRLERIWNECRKDNPEEKVRDAQTLRTLFRVSDFVTWQRDKALELNPNFQRRPVWKKGAKSFLIDTIIRGLPMPIIFLRDLPSDLKTFKAKRDVVDGQQRIRTILSFIDPELLPDFDENRDDFVINKTHNKDLAGKRFDDLAKADKQKILDYQFSVHSFPADTDDREILQIFARMNSTGVRLNAQELRNAEYYGPFKQKAYEIATEQLNRWRDWRIFTPDAIARMNEVELTSEFMILILSGTLERKRETIDTYYKDYDDDFDEADEVAERFRHVFDTIEASFPDETLGDLFKTRSMFYALFATVYGMQYGLRDPDAVYKGLRNIKPKAFKKAAGEQLLLAGGKIAEKRAPPRVLNALRGATSDASSRKIVIEYLAGGEYDPWRGAS